MVWNGTRFNLPKVEQLQFLQVGENGGQWNTRIGEIHKSNYHDESWDMGEEEGIDREKVDRSKTRGLVEREQIILGLLESRSRKSRQCGHRR